MGSSTSTLLMFSPDRGMYDRAPVPGLRYHSPGASRNSYAFSRYIGPARNGLVSVSYPNALLFQAGCCIVSWLPLMLCTGEYRSVKELTASTSTRLWFATLFR